MVSLFEVVRHVGHHSHPQESSRHCGKPVRLGFVDLGPSLETKRVLRLWRFILPAARLGRVGCSGLGTRTPFNRTDRCRSLRLYIDSGPNGECMISRLSLCRVRSVTSLYRMTPLRHYKRNIPSAPYQIVIPSARIQQERRLQKR